jgi:hypothetical protein
MKNTQNIELIKDFNNSHNVKTIDSEGDNLGSNKGQTNLKNISKGRDDFFEISFMNIFSFFLIIIYYLSIGYVGYGILLLFTYFFEVNTTINSYFLIVNDCFNPISLCFFIQVLLMTFFIVLFVSIYYCFKILFP